MAFPIATGAVTRDQGFGVSTFSDGSSIVTGSFYNTVTFGSTTLTASHVGSTPSTDGFVAKIDSNGNYLWAKQFGGTDTDQGLSVSTLSDGSCIITGFFQGAANFGDTTLNSSGNQDIFITKVDSNGNFLWATQAGGASGFDTGYSIDALNDGSSIITGRFIEGTASFGATTLTSANDNDTYIAKLDSNGNFLWVTQGTGDNIGSNTGSAVSSLSDGSSITTGTFSSSLTFGETTLENNGYDGIFITKVDGNGNVLWAKHAGGERHDSSNGISTLSDGSSIITGHFEGSASFGDITLTAPDYNLSLIHI